MDPALYPITITRGVTFDGFQLICADAAGTIVPLAGYKAFAQIRRDPDSPLLIDLLPEIAADDAAGVITIPPISHAATWALAEGSYNWGLILETPAGRRLPPLVAGTAVITTPIPQPA